MKYLITGGCGFLGSNIASHLLKKDYDVFIFDNLSKSGSDKNLKWLSNQSDRLNFIKGDIRDSSKINQIIKKIRPDVIFHFAGQVAMTTSVQKPFLDFMINTSGTLNILEAVRKFSKKTAVLYSSTNKVYGDLKHLNYKERETRYVVSNHPKGFTESLPLNFSTPYGCSKGSADQYMLDYSNTFGLKTIVFRHSTIYGPHQFATKEQGWVGWFCQKAYEIKTKKSTKPFRISGNGKQVRDLLYITDAVNCYMNATKNIDAISGQAYNIGGGVKNSLSLIELFNYLEKLLNIKMKYIQKSWRKSDQKIFIADTSKANNDFGWKPKIDWQTGVDNMYSWTKKVNE